MGLSFFILSTLLISGIKVEGQGGRVMSGVEFYLDPEGCPSNGSPYPIYTFCGVDVPNLELTIDPHNQSEISSWSLRGPWALYTDPDYSFDQSADGYVGLIATDPKYTACVFYQGLQMPLSLRRLGNPDPELPGLTLFYGFDEDGAAGPTGEPVHIDQEKTDFVVPFPVNFWAFTAYENWTLYSQPNFQGDSICLDPYAIDEGDYMAAFGWGNLLPAVDTAQVGSVRMGCHSEVVVGPDAVPLLFEQDGGGEMGLRQVFSNKKMAIEVNRMTQIGKQDESDGTKFLESCKPAA